MDEKLSPNGGGFFLLIKTLFFIFFKFIFSEVLTNLLMYKILIVNT